jgi:hypothetical protein
MPSKQLAKSTGQYRDVPPRQTVPRRSHIIIQINQFGLHYPEMPLTDTSQEGKLLSNVSSAF